MTTPVTKMGRDAVANYQAARLSGAGGREARAYAMARKDNLRLQNGYLGKAARNSKRDDVYEMPGNSCPVSLGKDENGYPMGGWRPVSENEAKRIDRNAPQFAEFSRVKEGGVYKKVVLQNGQRCMRYIPESAKPATTWDQVLTDLTDLAKHMRRDRLDMQEGLKQGMRDSERLWKEETRLRVEQAREQALERKYGPEAMFKPDPEKGCDPTGGSENPDWKKRFGTPQDPRNPNVQPSAYELATNRWYRPAIVEVDGQARCMPDDKAGLEEAYPLTYHDMDGLPEDELPMEEDQRMPRMKMYQKAAFCAQALNDQACDDGKEADAPFGGKLNSAETCATVGPKHNRMCVPREVRNASDEPNGIGDDPLNKWYGRMYNTERANMRKDQWTNLAMQHNLRTYADDPALKNAATAGRLAGVRPEPRKVLGGLVAGGQDETEMSTEMSGDMPSLMSTEVA